MPNCPKCQKAVYFAEKLTCLGRDYHRACLRCIGCSKALAPGDAVEHKGNPYHKLCHQKNHGPSGYGFGAALDSHKQTGGTSAANASSSSPIASSQPVTSNATPSVKPSYSSCSENKESPSSRPKYGGSSIFGNGSSAPLCTLNNNGVTKNNNPPKNSVGQSSWQSQKDTGASSDDVVKCGLTPTTYEEQPSWAFAEKDKHTNGQYKNRSAQSKALW